MTPLSTHCSLCAAVDSIFFIFWSYEACVSLRHKNRDLFMLFDPFVSNVVTLYTYPRGYAAYFGNFWSVRLNKRILQTQIPQEWMLATVRWDAFKTCNFQHALRYLICLSFNKGFITTVFNCVFSIFYLYLFC